MRLLKFMIVSLLSVIITLTGNVSWALEDITTDYHSLQDIDSTQIAKRFWDKKEEDNTIYRIYDYSSPSSIRELTPVPHNPKPGGWIALVGEENPYSLTELNRNYGDCYHLGDGFLMTLFTF